MARGEKYTPERVAAIVEALEGCNTRKVAAQCAGIHKDTIAAWCHRHPEFRKKCDEAESKAEKEMVEQIRKATKKDWHAAAHILERRNPMDWGKQEILHIDMSTKSDEELLEFYEAGRRAARLEAED